MKFFNTKIWRPLALSTCSLALLSIVANTLGNENAAKVNSFLHIETNRVVGGNGDSYFYKSEYEDLNSMVKDRAKLLVNVGQEGTVLLKNNNSLPLKKTDKVVLLNENSFVYATAHGGGSMASNENITKRTNPSRALKEAGLTVSDNAEECSSADAVIIIIGRSAGEGSDMAAGNLALSANEKALIKKATEANDNVIIIVSGDYVVEINDLKKDDKIKGIIKFGNAGLRGAVGLADVIVGNVSPSGKLVDTFSVSTTSSPAHINYGNYDFTNKNKIMASQAGKYVSYNEGIYTDYRYYETRYEDTILNQGNAKDSIGSTSSSEWKYQNEVAYPFGYGLSYAKFEKKIEKLLDKDDHFEISVNVKNTSDVGAKDVVQIYFQSPYTDYDKTNKIEKSSVQLVGFSKTKTLAKGEDETLTISIPKNRLCSYDYTNAKTYIMDAGTYYFSVGEDSHSAINNILAKKSKTIANGMDEAGDSSLVTTFNVKELDKVTYSTSKYTNSTLTNRFDDVDVNYWLEDSEKITYLSRSDWKNTYPKTLKLTAGKEMLASLNDTKKYENGKYNDVKDRAPTKDVKYVDVTNESSLTSGLSDGSLKTMNVTTLKDLPYDDPKWDEMLDNLSLYELSKIVSEGRVVIQAAPSVTFNGAQGDDGPTGVSFTFAYSKLDKDTGAKTALGATETISDGYDDIVAKEQDCKVYSSEPVLAATFNPELADETGRFYAEDGLYTGTSFLWGLGLNLHRTCYGGRNSEYYSADAILNGIIGSHVSAKALEHGLIVVGKHFAINEQEQNRIGVCTFTNEQALRENYLRSFEIAFTEGKLAGVMTAYNRIGVLSCTAEYDLITGVLREEWGSTCYAISDLNSPTPGLYDGNAAIIAGLSTFLNNGTYNASSGSATNTSLNAENIKANKQLLTACREACHRILFNFVNSSAVNGISKDSRVEYVTPWWSTTLISTSIAFSIVGVASFALLLTSILKGKKHEN